jgi:hypothetical protein
MADRELSRNPQDGTPAGPTSARTRAWASAKDARLLCPVEGCGEWHTYAWFITEHGYGIPPLPWGRLALETLQGDEDFIAGKAAQIAEAKRTSRFKHKSSWSHKRSHRRAA